MIEWAELVPHSESPAGNGVHGTMRCAIRVQGRAVAAYLKRMPRAKVLTEAFCAVLLRGWGLSVPMPYLVQEGDSLAFASADATYPSLLRRLSLDTLPAGSREQVAATLVGSLLAVSLPGAPLAATADEAVANADRNLGNILWDGEREAWIDHESALGIGCSPDANKLCAMACATGQAGALQQSAIAQALAIDRSMPLIVARDLMAQFDATGHARIVSDRMADLGRRLLSRFPTPDDLLSGA